MHFFATILPLILSFTSSISAADTGSWKSRSIYFALTDRISRSSSDTTSCANLGNYCGGTFKGLESKLDYIKGLGFDAVWVTPVVASEKHFNTERRQSMLTHCTDSAGGYHGYWTQDLYSVNINYGTPADLKSLVNTAHGKVRSMSYFSSHCSLLTAIGYIYHGGCGCKPHGSRRDLR